MTKAEQIKEQIKRITASQAVMLNGTVTAIDTAKAMATVDLGNGLEIDDVRLKGFIAAQNHGAYTVPKVGSVALLLRILNSDDFHLIACSEIDHFVARTQDVELVIGATEIVFNQGAQNSFMTNINSLKDKLNALETQINNLKSVFASWVPVTQDGGAALKTAATSWASSQMAATTVNDLKDAKIKH